MNTKRRIVRANTAVLMAWLYDRISIFQIRWAHQLRTVLVYSVINQIDVQFCFKPIRRFRISQNFLLPFFHVFWIQFLDPDKRKSAVGYSRYKNWWIFLKVFFGSSVRDSHLLVRDRNVALGMTESRYLTESRRCYTNSKGNPSRSSRPRQEAPSNSGLE